MKINNNGYSLVELIIVIAIMAILSSALTISYLKYINKAAIVSDQQTCKTIEKLVYTILTEDNKIYYMYASQAAMNTDRIAFIIAPEIDRIYRHSNSIYQEQIATSIKNGIPNLKTPKEFGKHSYYINVDIHKTTKKDKYNDTDIDIYSVGDINVRTISVYQADEVKTFLQNEGYTRFQW